MKSIAIMGAFIFFFLACGSPHVTQSPNELRPPTLPQPPSAESRTIGLELDEGLGPCPDAQPHFPYDVAQPRLMDRPELVALAECLNSADRRHLDLVLVGRTDSEGSTAYNDELGRRRAEDVKEALVSLGVDANRLSTVSAGERGAVADSHTEAGYDRRVDVVQLNVVHSPE